MQIYIIYCYGCMIFFMFEEFKTKNTGLNPAPCFLLKNYEVLFLDQLSETQDLAIVHNFHNIRALGQILQ